jgi:16S rRNA (uracil1498-N3)-methyltransferase
LEISDIIPLDHNPEATLQVTLYQGFARGDKLEWIVQKATELGLARLVPMVTAHSQVRLAETGSHKITRWQEIARQATRQSGRVRVPDIAAPVTFEQAVAEARQADVAVIPFEHAEGAQSWKARLAQVSQPVTVALLVGPEGGFSEAEVTLARSSGIIPVSLGPRILRSETAGLTVVAMALFQWGDLGGQA